MTGRNSSTSSELSEEEQAVRIALGAHAAHFAAAAGDYDRALAQAELALAEAQALAGPPELAQCQYVVGMIHGQLQHYAQAIESLRAAYDLYRAQGNLLGVADTALLLGLHLQDGNADYQSAIPYIDGGLAIYRTLGDRFDLAAGLNIAAHVRWYGAGDAEGAERLYQECLQTALAVENRLDALQGVGGLAFAALARGQWDLAFALQDERLALARHLGHDHQVKTSLSTMAMTYTYAERYADALALLDAHPEVWGNYTVPQAHIGVGEFGAGFAFLRQATSENLAGSGRMPYTNILLVGWAMLLASECALLLARDPLAPHILPAGERDALVVELLLAVESYAQTDPATRARARRLLAAHDAKMGDTPRPAPPQRSVQELANAMLALRLG